MPILTVSILCTHCTHSSIFPGRSPVDAEAQMVRWVFEMYTQQQLNVIARQLNQRQIPHPRREGWLAATNDMAYAAESGLPRKGLLWQNGSTTATAEHPVSATAKSFAASRHGEPGASTE